MDAALAAAFLGNSPIAAAAVTPTGELLALQANAQHSSGDVTCHAERLVLSALAAAGVPAIGVWVVSNAEPCSMCASALVKARVAGVAYGAPAEPSMDPWLPVAQVFAAAATPPQLSGPIDGEAHARTIAQGRRLAHTARAHQAATVLDPTTAAPRGHPGSGHPGLR